MIFLIEATVFLRGFIFHAAKNIISLSPNRRLVKPTIVAEKRLPQLQGKCVFPKKIQPKHFNYLLKVPFFSLLDVLVAPKIIYSNYSHQKKKNIYIYAGCSDFLVGNQPFIIPPTSTIASSQFVSSSPASASCTSCLDLGNWCIL